MEQSDIPQPAVLTVEEAHQLVGKDKIGRNSFYNALKNNEIPHLRLGRRIVIPRQRFLDWLYLRDT